MTPWLEFLLVAVVLPAVVSAVVAYVTVWYELRRIDR